MYRRKLFCIFFACLLTIGSIGIPVSAAETASPTPESFPTEFASPRATVSFNITIAANETVSAEDTFSLAAGELVEIKLYYSPASANMDVGLVDSNGSFYYANVSNGNIDKAIQVNKSGKYTFQIRNNSNTSVEVQGFVYY